MLSRLHYATCARYCHLTAHTQGKGTGRAGYGMALHARSRCISVHQLGVYPSGCSSVGIVMSVHTHPRTMRTAKTRTEQEKRWKENSAGTAELS